MVNMMVERFVEIMLKYTFERDTVIQHEIHKTDEYEFISAYVSSVRGRRN